MTTLYEWAGGEEAIRRLMDAFYDRVEGDELLSPFFPGGVNEEHRAHVTAGGAEVFGGDPLIQRGPRRIREHARAPPRTRDHPRAAVPLRIATASLAADDARLPDDAEFRSAFVAYVEWGTRIALHNSQPGAEVIPHAPVPRWGWGEAPPFRG